MAEIVRFEFEHLDKLRLIFLENVPQYFAQNEWKDFENYIKKNFLTHYVIVNKKGKLIGTGGYHLVSETTARLSWDFISQNNKGLGYGKKLISFCLEEISLNSKIISVEVWTSQFAQGFYFKFGFVTFDIEKDFWAEGLDLYKMQKKLRKLS